MGNWHSIPDRAPQLSLDDGKLKKMPKHPRGNHGFTVRRRGVAKTHFILNLFCLSSVFFIQAFNDVR